MGKVCGLDSFYVGWSDQLCTKIMWINRQLDPLRTTGLLKYLTFKMCLSTSLFAINPK